MVQVCGSDGKTYRNSCELQYISCKKYWDLRVVSKVGALKTSQTISIEDDNKFQEDL